MSTVTIKPVAISKKYEQLGGSGSLLGRVSGAELVCPDGSGRYRHFQGGSIYWHPETGAHEVHGAIREKWSNLGWEKSFLGYPATDEKTTPDGAGRYNHFQGGSIYWYPKTGAHEVHGAIREKWSKLGWEKSFLGYPVSDETAGLDGMSRRSRFQYGVIAWHPKWGAFAFADSTQLKPCDVDEYGQCTWAGDWGSSWFSPTGEYIGNIHIDLGGVHPSGYQSASGYMTFAARPGDLTKLNAMIGITPSGYLRLFGTWERVKGSSGGAVQWGKFILDLYAELGTCKFRGYWSYGEDDPLYSGKGYLWGGSGTPWPY